MVDFVKMTEQEEKKRGSLFTKHKCASCSKHSDKLVICIRCWSVKYCNFICQTVHWKVHKMECMEHKNNSISDNNMEDTVTLAREEQERHGPWEVDISFIGNRGLAKNYKCCEKNPGHKNFIPIKRFNVRHLPPGYRDNNIVCLVRALADITVRVSVKYVSERRPQTIPETNVLYPNYRYRGMKVMTAGTGWVSSVEKYSGKCNCNECMNSSMSETNFADICINTATHVVYDHIERDHTTCYLFFDKGYKPDDCIGAVKLTMPTRVVNEIHSDLCQLIYTTHDMKLAYKLEKMVERCKDLMNIVSLKSEISSSSQAESLWKYEYKREVMKYADSTWSKCFPATCVMLSCLSKDDSISDFLKNIVNHFKDFMRQTMDTSNEAEEQIHQPSLSQFSNLMFETIEQKLFVDFRLDDQLSLFDLLCVCSVMKMMLHNYIYLLTEMWATNIESDKEISSCDVHSACEAMKELTKLFDQLLEQIRSTNVESDKQIIQSMIDSAYDAIIKISYWTNYVLKQIIGKNVDSDKQSQLSHIKFLSYFMLTLAQLSQCQLDLKRDITVGTDEQISHIKVYSYVEAMEKVMQLCTDIFNDIKHLESEKLKSQPQVGPIADSQRALTIIVSHLHGCSKQVSIGYCTSRDVNNDLFSSLTYTTPTCPGSSGACVCVVGISYLFHHTHSKSCSVSEQINKSASVFNNPWS